MKIKDRTNCPNAIPSNMDASTFKSLAMICKVSGFPCAFVSVEGCQNTIDILEEDNNNDN